MLSYVGRSSQLSPALKGVSQTVTNGLKNVVPAVALKNEPILPGHPTTLTVDSMAKYCATGPVRARSGIAVSSQVRYAHTDIQVPDFSAYRRDDVRDSRAKAGDSNDARRSFSYLIAGGGCVTGAYAAKAIVSQFLSSMSASADVLALAKIEIKLDDIPEGKSVTFKWRGKPLFVRHRPQSEVDTEAAVDLSTLRDVQHDSERCSDPSWLIVIGVCTHLGCVPVADAGDFGGYYCPCHGSHYDASGRIRKGPAPLNLEVPPYVFPGDGTLVVG
ncbi:cytochrome b-c1 complex subunit Rieske, mitochondrial-like [Oratosquilla oratoria]|uniref:cytochrome b-c1 complex subunit Rieske, mitochondrial-like n=1 Tax=Oratosquilla oratoria TaxID=337810 RepID=UPI003F75C044